MRQRRFLDLCFRFDSKEGDRGHRLRHRQSPQPTDPKKHVTTLKTGWTNVRANAGVKGRWHDNRHAVITELAESVAGDQTMDIAGHVSKQMLKHYSHIRMEAKRSALEAIIRKRSDANESQQEYPQKSPQWPPKRQQSSAKRSRTEADREIHCRQKQRTRLLRIVRNYAGF